MRFSLVLVRLVGRIHVDLCRLSSDLCR
ncbi:putative leader peptide [Planobispora rosea]